MVNATTKGSVVVRADAEWDALLLPPRCPPAFLDGVELTSMRAAIAIELGEEAPHSILAQKYFRLRLMVGGTAGSRPAGSDCTKQRRRNYFLRICSTERVRQPDGRSVVTSPAATYGAVLHYAVVFVDSRPMWFAYVASVRSVVHCRDRFGYAARRHGISCITGIDGERFSVPSNALEGMVGTLEREGVRFILNDTESFFGRSMRKLVLFCFFVRTERRRGRWTTALSLLMPAWFLLGALPAPTMFLYPVMMRSVPCRHTD